MIKFNFENFVAKSLEYERKVKKASELFAETAGKKLIEECQNDAKWIDRTGLSRQTMDYKVLTHNKNTLLKLRGNTPQFIYLELCNEKKFAILFVVLNKHKGNLVKEWAKVLRK